ncbi:MAG: FtsX-like permease family protein [Desulfobacteraceae bacterium]|nr:FtsX-like permease family protein [Desulfobacteraceae bacterium]
MSERTSPIRHIPALAASHLLHEWVMSLCLVVALAAVIAPLFVLLGLKYGTIQTLRERLVEDPIFREIRPTQTQVFSSQWFAELSSWPETGFITPTILPLSSVINVVQNDSGKTKLYDLVPTAPGDPLLLENDGIVPVDGEVVLTTEAALESGIGVGEELIVRVTRSQDGRKEAAESRLRVVAVLDQRAGSLARVYAPLSLVLDVEAYKEGYAAPARGWAGATPEPYLSFDGAVLLLPEPLPAITRTGLIINSGFGRIAELSAIQVRALLGFLPPQDFAAYDLFTPGSPVTISSLRAVDQKLRGRTRALLPYVRDLKVTAAGNTLQPLGLSINAEQAQLLKIPETPWGGYNGNLPECDRLLQALWPSAKGRALTEQTEHREVEVQAAGVGEVAFALHSAGTTSFERPVLPVELLGVLRTGKQRAITFEPDGQCFAMARGGYRGFRLYARSIDDVPVLYNKLRSQGIDVLAEVAAIERIHTLDQGLTRLFLLIALLGLFGGTAVLVASLYAAVERRRRDLGVLRLLGFARRHVFFFPMAQGLMLAVLGLLAGLGGYAVLAGVINQAFAKELAVGEAFCAMPWRYLPVFGFSTLILAVLASLTAAWRATNIDPAEVIREQ